MHRVWRVVACFAAAAALLQCASCEQQQAPEPDAQVIVIGAGLSGLSAAVEMGRSGLKVLVVDMNSVAGGHTMLAGGVAMAATQLQESLGIEDSAELQLQQEHVVRLEWRRRVDTVLRQQFKRDDL